MLNYKEFLQFIYNWIIIHDYNYNCNCYNIIQNVCNIGIYYVIY